MERNIKTIDLADYRQTGEGANGASYDCIADPQVMVKLYFDGYDKETIYVEQEVARKVYDLGIPSPEPGELVTDGKHLGIRFRRIAGKRSFSRIFADEPERTEEFARAFARRCKELHSVECPDGVFPEAKPQFSRLCQASKYLTDSQKQVVEDFIASVPDCTTALHGDMHFGNIITTLPKGAAITEPHDTYFIDLGYFSRGCPLFDLGMMHNICLIADDEFRKHDMHIDGKQTAVIWDHFVDEYFFGPENFAAKWFGEGQDIASVTRALAPYACLKILLVEYNLGIMLPHYGKAIDETFGFQRQ